MLPQVLLAGLELLLELLLDVGRHVLELAELLRTLRRSLFESFLLIFADPLFLQEFFQIITPQTLLHGLLAQLGLEFALDLLLLHLAELFDHPLLHTQLGPQQEALFDVRKLLLRKVGQALFGA